MLQQTLNKKIIDVIKANLPEGENVQQLMDILSIGKESAYRRLRGDVLFTFDEVAKISQRFNISIDNMVGMLNNKAVFNLNFMEPRNENNNNIKLESQVAAFKEMQKARYNIARYVVNNIPYNFYLSYKNISKFKYFKWLYQVNIGSNTLSYKELELSAEVRDLQKRFISESNNIQHSLFIVDRAMFAAMISDIEYFFKLHLISMEDFKLLQTELLDILTDIESFAVSGKNKAGNNVSIYLSNVYIESTYCHFEYDDKQSAYFTLYSMDGVSSQLPDVCQKQKEWIKSLKRYSTLITQSGEIHRAEFFKAQRELINNMFDY